MATPAPVASTPVVATPAAASAANTPAQAAPTSGIAAFASSTLASAKAHTDGCSATVSSFKDRIVSFFSTLVDKVRTVLSYIPVINWFIKAPEATAVPTSPAAPTENTPASNQQ
jgi:hypothetical protein